MRKTSGVRVGRAELAPVSGVGGASGVSGVSAGIRCETLLDL